MTNRTKEYVAVISIVIIALIIIIFISYDLYQSYLQLTEGKEERTDFLYSEYSLYIFYNESISQIVIKIPYSTYTFDMGDSQFDDISFEHENTTYGNIIRTVTELDGSLNLSWTFDKPIAMNNFSTVDNDSIWIYCNKTNTNDRLYFLLLKEDKWDTKAILYTQVDYMGVMNSSFPTEVNSFREHDEFIYRNGIQLMDGWHKYSLINGTYFQYSD